MKRKIKTTLSIGLLISILCGNLNSFADNTSLDEREAINPIENTENFSAEYMSGPYYEALKEVNLTGNYRTDMIEVASSQIGYCEGDEENQWDGTKAGSKDHTEYGRFLKSDGSAWCSEFASWCARMAGVPTYILNSSKGANAKRFGAPYYTWKETIFGGGSYTPQMGDLVLWAVPGTADADKSLSHTAIFYEAQEESEFVILSTIDGNSGNIVRKVNSKVYATSGLRDNETSEVAFFVAPNYESDGTEITLNKDSHEMKVGERFQLEVNNGFDTKLNVTWSSSDPKIASVDDKGRVKAIKEGQVSITAKVDDITLTCSITVIGTEKLKELVLNHTSYEMNITETLELKAETKGFDSEPEIVWSSSNNEIASVDKNGKVKPLKEGEVTITAKAENVQAVCKITIVEEENNQDKLSINYTSYELKVGEKVQLKVATSSNASRKQESEIEWHSNNQNVASVDENGLVTGISKGNAIISAKVNDLSADCKIIVTSSSSGSSSSTGGSSSSGGSGGGSSSSGGGSRRSTSNTSNSGTSLPSYVEKGEWTIVNGFWQFSDASGNPHVNTWAAAYNPYASAGHQNYDWFRFDINGNMLTGWFLDADGSRYFLNPLSDGTLGKMMTGWVWIADEFGVQRCYYFNPNSDGYRGKLMTNTIIDGYTIDTNGCWIMDGVVQTK